MVRLRVVSVVALVGVALLGCGRVPGQRGPLAGTGSNRPGAEGGPGGPTVRTGPTLPGRPAPAPACPKGASDSEPVEVSVRNTVAPEISSPRGVNGTCFRAEFAPGKVTVYGAKKACSASPFAEMKAAPAVSFEVNLVLAPGRRVIPVRKMTVGGKEVGELSITPHYCRSEETKKVLRIEQLQIHTLCQGGFKANCDAGLIDFLTKP